MTTEPWPLTETTTRAIGAMPATTLRNRLITQTYHAIATEILTATRSDVANWFHFATWASASVGAIMRGDVLPGWLRRALVGSGEVLGEGDHSTPLLAACEEEATHITNLLAEGNVRVFRQMGAAGVAFLGSRTGSDAERAAAAARLQEIVTSAEIVHGTDALGAGFDALAAAAHSADPTLGRQHVLGGSLMLGVEEQARLQSVLARVISSLPDDLAGSLERRLPWPVLRRAARVFDRQWDGLMTRDFLVLVLPGERLRLGEDVPALAGRPLVPYWMTRPTAPSLRQALATWDRTGRTGSRDAARDWAELADRMDWITWCFAARFQERSVRSEPFPTTEVDTLRRALGSDRQSVQRFSVGPTRAPR